MKLSIFKNTFLLCVFTCFSCGSQTNLTNANPSKDVVEQQIESETSGPIIVGANQYSAYLPLLKDKNIAIVANQTTLVEIPSEVQDENTEEITTIDIHLVDFLLSRGIAVKKAFGPEHGFRGKADPGEEVKDGIDPKSGVPIISLYGKNKWLSTDQLKDIDMVIFDVQDVGARFYTFISTLHYVMQACAEAGIPILVLDRPNPNGHYIDGPILEAEHKSFVGMHPVPVVHGMTLGEYATMINGEGWLKGKVKCDLTVIKVKNYTHETEYSLKVKPSPNLPNDKAINLYPSLCFFEGTFVSAGRGTTAQFQIFGAPTFTENLFPLSFQPIENEGAKNPKFKGRRCWGKNLRSTPKLSALNLQWLLEAYKENDNKMPFFNDYFTKLAGTKKLQEQIEAGISEEEIKKTWAAGLESYDKMRQAYMLYD